MKRSRERSNASPFPDRDPSVFYAALDAYASHRLHEGAKLATVRYATGTLRRIARDLGSPTWTMEAIRRYGRARAAAGIKGRAWRGDVAIVKRFCDDLRDPAYGWRERFIEAYGIAPTQPIPRHDGLPQNTMTRLLAHARQPRFETAASYILIPKER